MTDERHAPRAIAHGWYASSSTGQVDEVWVFGRPDSAWFAVALDGRIVMQGIGGLSCGWLSDTKVAAVQRVLEEANDALSNARAAVDKLRAEMATA